MFRLIVAVRQVCQSLVTSCCPFGDGSCQHVDVQSRSSLPCLANYSHFDNDLTTNRSCSTLRVDIDDHPCKAVTHCSECPFKSSLHAVIACEGFVVGSVSHSSLQWWWFVGTGLLRLEQHGDQLLRLSGCNPHILESAKELNLPSRLLFAAFSTLVPHFLSPQPS